MIVCYNPKASGFAWYGGKGVEVAEEWCRFEQFLEDMGHPPTEKHTLDRIDSNGNYEPSNCRWATRHEQMRNTSNNRWITFDGRTQILQDWAIETGLSQDCISRRLYKYGWSVEKALTKPSERAK